MNMKKILIGLGITTVILILILVFVRKQKSKQITTTPSDSKPSDSGSSGSSNSNGSSNTTLDRDKLLKKSSTGEEVKELQRWINDAITIAKNKDTTNMSATELARNYAIAVLTPLTVDGQFGSGTEQALDIITNKTSIKLKDLSLYALD